MNTTQFVQSPRFLFGSLCLLVACRDVFSQKILTNSVDPVFMVTVYCLSSTILAYGIGIIRNRKLSGDLLNRLFTKSTWPTTLKLGVATWVVYAATVFGIQAIGAAKFNTIDWSAVPIFTMATGLLLMRDKATTLNILGCLAGLSGFIIMALHSGDVAKSYNTFGILLAIASASCTALSSYYQKRQVDTGLHPEHVVLQRFLVPSALMLGWSILGKATPNWEALPGLLTVSAFGVFLPILLLCFGFVKSSLSYFASYLYAIPILTFVMSAVFIKGGSHRLLESWSLISIALVLGGYIASERSQRLTLKSKKHD